ncbi:MAG: hypothetical protein JWR77_1945 [Rhizorhabdus sp.]|nr:hypothetical protein [Rhizorhabdus sp.]
MSAIGYFLATIILTLLITAWAARKATSKASLYSASGTIGPTQNGFALAGDFLSAGTVLGIVGLYFTVGVDVSLYFMAPMAGLCLLLLFIVGPLRRLGTFTLGDVLASRFSDPRLRVMVGICTIVISLINLVAQLVGAGALISILFGPSFALSVLIVATLMGVYVVFGGMLAATWVQIIKAAILIATIGALAFLCMRHTDGIIAVFDRIRTGPESAKLLSFGGLGLGLFSALSLGIAEVTGIMGTPHLLIRFFTVPDAKAARRSLVVATTLIGIAMGTIFLVVSPAAVVLVGADPAFRNPDGSILGGVNMVTMHLARILGGNPFVGLMSAVAFSTILAVVAGLTIAISSAASHDVLGALRRDNKLSDREEIWWFRCSAVATCIVAALLSILFKAQNLTFLIVMGYTVASCTTFPLLILSIYWPGFSPRGALWCASVGLVTSVGGIILGPAVWDKVLGLGTAPISTDYPTLVALPLALLAAWLGSNAKTAQPMPVAQ